MSTRFTKQQILESACGALNPHLAEKPVKKGSKVPKKDLGAKYKQWMYETLKKWCEANSCLLIREHTFSEERGWRFDFAVFKGTQNAFAVEYNGIMSKKSRHTTRTGYTGDMEKLNTAQALGWKVYQYTPLNYLDLENDLK